MSLQIKVSSKASFPKLTEYVDFYNLALRNNSLFKPMQLGIPFLQKLQEAVLVEVRADDTELMLLMNQCVDILGSREPTPERTKVVYDLLAELAYLGQCVKKAKRAARVQNAGAARTTYQGRSYKIRQGQRGGSYIVVRGQKRYVRAI